MWDHVCALPNAPGLPQVSRVNCTAEAPGTENLSVVFLFCFSASLVLFFLDAALMISLRLAF